MYRVTDEEGNVLQQTDDVRFVRLKEESGAWIRCTQALAQCIAVNGVRYSIEGRAKVEDAPVVVRVQEVDAGNEMLQNSKATQSNTEEIVQTQKALVDVYESGLSTEDELTKLQLAITELYENLI